MATIDDAGRFLDQWGSMAAQFQWTAGELFDVPHDGKPGGLIWALHGNIVASIGAHHASLCGGSVVYDKATGLVWLAGQKSFGTGNGKAVIR